MSLRLLCRHLVCLIALVPIAGAADPDAAAELTITDEVLRPADKVPPLGVNNWGRCGAVEWAANNFFRNPGNEPIWWRNLHRVVRSGDDWFEIDGPGTSWWDLWTSGFLSGAEVRIYRIVDAQGRPLPLNQAGNNLDLATADRVVLVGTSTVLPEGSQGFPDGGWVANRYAAVYPNATIRHGNITATDASGLENGRTYWYTVTALGRDNKESAPSNEVSASPRAGLETPPRVTITRDGDSLPELRAGAPFEFAPAVVGGQPPFQWTLLDPVGNRVAPPAGLTFAPETGRLAGRPAAAVGALPLIWQVTDARGRSDRRAFTINPAAAAAAGELAPPTALRAVAADGQVTLTWQPSPSPNVVGYRLKRSTAPAAEQEMRVHLTPGGPKLERFDYVVLSRRFGNFDMKYVNPRVRGIGNPMNSPGWYWNGDQQRLKFSLAPHPQPLPAEMTDPGETCLRVDAAAGEQSIDQYTFIGTAMGNESLWYGQLEPGRTYRLEVWLRQEGLADGKVTFSFGRGYPNLREEFQVTGQWGCYRAEFVGPERPGQEWHFGPRFTFTGPGTLWLDNARLYRRDTPEDAEKPYVPNRTVLDELLSIQPEAGRKGTHRIWFLTRDATMDSILSWHAGSQVRPDWRTAVSGTMEMTLPMGLSFDLATGPDPASRMRPWLVLQHILHTEQDWLNLVEYLAAPYDPARDNATTKPYAHRRYLQRGVATPWTDEFAEILLEFGNETWHNGLFDDWLGFATRNAVHQGGREYGLFTRYLVEQIQQSPYWRSEGLAEKIRFVLGGNYDGRAEANGRVRGYGEEAMQANPEATVLGHANYVGPKWETGDYSARNYDDHGVQECLLSFLTGPRAGQERMGQAREALARAGLDYDIAAYEGGPGGFAIPGRADPAQVEINEKYGKSLAQAVGAFDAWMQSYQFGWTEQCFFSYGQGNHWNSHTPLWNGFRPAPAWLAAGLRNRQAGGDLMRVEATTTPTIARRDQDLPLVGGYAFRDGTRWTIFVVSRKLDGRHDGADFGDGTTPVTLRLPFERARSVTLFRLAADPRLTNREAMNVAVERIELPATSVRGGVLRITPETGGIGSGLPPGAIYGYVVEAE